MAACFHQSADHGANEKNSHNFTTQAKLIVVASSVRLETILLYIEIQ